MNINKLLDTITNSYLMLRFKLFKSTILRHNRIKELRAIIRAEEVMTPVLLLNENTLTQKTFDEHFRVGHEWGISHPQNANQYWTSNSVVINSLNQIYLSALYKPLMINNTMHLYDVGVIVSKQSYKHAFFNVRARLPLGPFLWPAIWLSNNWPPEVDIIEYYTGKKKGAESNLHFGMKDRPHESGALNYGLLPTDQFIDFSCLYVPNKYIKIYYNGYLVRKITDKETLLWFIGESTKLIINNGVMDAAKASCYNSFTISEIEIWKPVNT